MDSAESRVPGLRHYLVPLTAILFVVGGGIVHLTGGDASLREKVWLAGLLLTGTPVVVKTLKGMIAGRFAADVVAFLAIIAAVALGQPIVGLVIVLMQTGGEALERFAEGRASRAVRDLEAMAPQIAHRKTADGIVDVRVDDVVVGDILLLRPGELVPCDSVVVEGRSHVDTSQITGEPLPISAEPGTHLLSGTANGDGALTLRSTAISRESQYARIVELVRSAQASKSPLQRTADRYAVWFTPVTIALCAVTYALTHDAMRVLAILAVATPCPLIIATPVAVLGGINRAARRQIIVRHGTALERVGETTTAVFDKTGTLTLGRPEVRRVMTMDGWSEHDVLMFASGVEQASSHLLARTLVEGAVARGISPPAAQHVVESAGRGVEGRVDGHDVLVGAWSFARERYPHLTEARIVAAEAGTAGGIRLLAYVAIDGRLAGVVEYADALRPEAHNFLRTLARLGVRRILLLSGDHSENTRVVAAQLGITDYEGDLLPQDKVARVHRLTKEGEVVLMAGDGTNDAPALSAATVGIALAGHGGGITAEAADIVSLTDDLSRVAEAISISRRTMRIARQGIHVGLGLSFLAMIGGATGIIAPVAGAMLQEAIDLTVILNALRASAPGRREGPLVARPAPPAPEDGKVFPLPLSANLLKASGSSSDGTRYSPAR